MATNRLIALLVTAVFCVSSARAVTISTAPIGNPGNPPDPRYAFGGSGFGSVPYPFRMGKTEVTNVQYVEFLRAVAPSDSYGLYSTSMASSTWGGIVRSGSAGSFTYAVKASAVGQGPGGTDYTYDDKPVVFVSWFDALRFANWLHNGQGGPGTTEDGAYTLLGGTPTPSNWRTITRNPGARWWLPSEDEWYKAAYNDPNAGVYYDYPTGTNSAPNNNLPSADTGNSVNYWNGNYTTGNSNYPMTDADAYILSTSPYGTLDQGGNVREWDETLIDRSGFWFGVTRGGSWRRDRVDLRASAYFFVELDEQRDDLGFRVASIPEPSTLLLGALASMGLLWRRRS